MVRTKARDVMGSRRMNITGCARHGAAIEITCPRRGCTPEAAEYRLRPSRLHCTAPLVIGNEPADRKYFEYDAEGLSR